jgi:hypothetical protein
LKHRRRRKFVPARWRSEKAGGLKAQLMMPDSALWLIVMVIA